MRTISVTPLQLGHGGGLPESPPEDYESQDEFLKSAHHALMEVSLDHIANTSWRGIYVIKVINE